MSLASLALLLITPHLVSQGRPACSLLPQQYCRGKSFAHFADSDPARKFPGWLCCRMFPTEAISWVFPVVLLLSLHCIFLDLSFLSTPLFLFVLLAPVHLFIYFLLHLARLSCFQEDYLILFPLIHIQSLSCFYRIS